jgi:4-hydroxy-2-oxoheptanedioate aldolase
MNFRKKLRNLDKVIGTWFTVPSVHMADVICSSGLDFIIIDREHGPHSFETVYSSAIAARSHGVAPIVRCSSTNASEILNVADLGVAGLQFPNINKPEQIEEIIENALYQPEGNRGFSPFTRNGMYGGMSPSDVPSRSNEELSLIVNIESIESVNNIEDFIKYDRVDAFFIGMYDLSKSLGTPGVFTSNEFNDAIEHVVRACNDKNVSVGTITGDAASTIRYSDMGMNYLVYAVDCNVLRTAYSSIVQEVIQHNES